MRRILTKIIKRSLTYIRQGYSLASLPFTFVAYTSSIYYLMIVNVPVLHAYFPSFRNFILISGVLFLIWGLIGYAYLKKTWLYRTFSEIMTESNPYTSQKITPVQIPQWEAIATLCQQQGIDTSEMRDIIALSKLKTQ